MSRAHSPTFPSLHLRHSLFSNPSVASPKSQFILQPFRYFTYVTAHSPTLLSLQLRHRLFTWRSAHGKALYTISASIFVDVPYWSLYRPGPSLWFFNFGEEIVIAWTQEKTTTLGCTKPHILHDKARSHTSAVTDLLRRWQWEILKHSPYSLDMSPCDYDLFVKERTLRGTRYNTRN